MIPSSSRNFFILYILIILRIFPSASSFTGQEFSFRTKNGARHVSMVSQSQWPIFVSHRHGQAPQHRMLLMMMMMMMIEKSSSFDKVKCRRQIIQWPIKAIILSTMMSHPRSILAIENSSRLYIDPQGLFSLLLPKRFFVIRRETNGEDSPSSSKSGNNSILLTAGDLSKAQLISIERFSISQFLQQQAGISSESVSSSLTTLFNIASPQVLVQLLIQRRERDKIQQQGFSTRIIPDSIHVSSDNLSMTFQLATEIPVQKPELLMEQYGVNQLIRVTLGKVSIARGDGTMMVLYASGLQQDLRRIVDGSWTVDGQALQESIQSFVPTPAIMVVS